MTAPVNRLALVGTLRREAQLFARSDLEGMAELAARFTAAADALEAYVRAVAERSLDRAEGIIEKRKGSAW